MLGNIVSGARHVVVSWFGGFGTASSMLGGAQQAGWLPAVVPVWVWWSTAIVLLFIAACRAQYSLEKEQTKKPNPTMDLESLVVRITGDQDWAVEGAAHRRGKVLPIIREKARLGMISVWGREDAVAGHLAAYPLEPIPAEFWSFGQIDYLSYLKDPRCPTSNARQGGIKRFSDLHFDAAEVQKVWPKKRRKRIWRFQSPIARNTS